MNLDYKNCNIHFTVEGKGEPIILLHGFLETTDMWKEITPELTKTHQIVSIDLLGHGKTECLGYVHTMEAMAEAVLAVLNHLGITKAHFIGHSMGAYVALALAEKEPQLFNGLCLMNSTFEADNQERKAIRARACKMAHTNYKALVKMSFSNLFSLESKLKHDAEFNTALQLALKTPAQGYIAAQEGMALRPNRFEILKRIKGKTLIIIGEKDGLVNADELIHKIRNTSISYTTLSEGHMSYIENKSELTYNLLRFIEN